MMMMMTMARMVMLAMIMVVTMMMMMVMPVMMVHSDGEYDVVVMLRVMHDGTAWYMVIYDDV